MLDTSHVQSEFNANTPLNMYVLANFEFDFFSEIPFIYL